MPELPEVETSVRWLRPRVRGRTVTGFSASWPRQIEPGIPAVHRAVRGRTIVRVGRRGKHILLHLDNQGCLMLHLGMSGRLAWAADCPEEPAHVRAVLRLDDGNRMLFCDARKFGRIRYVPDAQAACAHLGPEPLSRRFTVQALRRALAGRTRRIKPLLLSQEVVAGLGNIYADEALHRARLHPSTPADRLTATDIRRLHRAVQQVLSEAVRRCGTSFDWVYPGGRMQHHLRVYRRNGKACRTCGTPIVRIEVGQRSTHLCPRCQKPRA